ncbi:hypothetical protein P7K49_034161 [Saguinus oedipus]|uniref:Uncharacterized protein n=1 Tax=Saguinus oedipus TaxID=9490 RepID=A0ABQ9TUI2_SAGOE|nr:hypothetical protein P7K49_034161 [Saguinus oedipus]
MVGIMRSGPEASRPLRPTSSLTHTELSVELVGKQGVRQLSEVELAEGGNAVDVLQKGGARQLRDPLTVKLMPETTVSRRRKIQVRGVLLTWPCSSCPYSKVPTGGWNPLPQVLHWAFQRQNLTELPNKPVWQRRMLRLRQRHLGPQLPGTVCLQSVSSSYHAAAILLAVREHWKMWTKSQLLPIL